MAGNSMSQNSFFIRGGRQDDLDLSTPPADMYAGLQSGIWIIVEEGYLDLPQGAFESCGFEPRGQKSEPQWSRLGNY